MGGRREAFVPAPENLEKLFWLSTWNQCSCAWFYCVWVCVWCVCVCVSVSVVAMWCSGCVLGSGPEVLSSSPNQAIFDLIFLPLPPTSPPSCDWVPGICWNGNLKAFLMQQQWSRWDFECPHHLLWGKACSPVSSRSFACTAHSACLVHRHPGSARCVWPPGSSKKICIWNIFCVCL